MKIPCDVVQFLLKLIETGNSFCVPRFSWIAGCHKIVDSQTPVMLC